jgi:myo-inositol-1(or 4)-monophosphatase
MDLDALKQFITRLARESEAVIMPYFADPGLVIERKIDTTPVTAADREAEALMRQLISERFRARIIGEEYGSERPDAEFVWVLDPVDGTKTFTAKNAQFGTLIGLLHEGRPLLGVINLPATRQFLLGDGRTTTLNGRPVGCASRGRSTRRSSSPPSSTPRQGQDPTAGPRGTLGARLYTWGDCYGYYLVAARGGHRLRPRHEPWDLLPLIPCSRVRAPRSRTGRAARRNGFFLRSRPSAGA